MNAKSVAVVENYMLDVFILVVRVSLSFLQHFEGLQLNLAPSFYLKKHSQHPGRTTITIYQKTGRHQGVNTKHCFAQAMKSKGRETGIPFTPN